MLFLFRVLMCCLCCVFCALASSLTPLVDSIYKLTAVLDDFNDAFGDKPNQCMFGAAKGVIESGKRSLAYNGKGYWYSYADGESKVTGHDDLIIAGSNFVEAVDTVLKCLHVNLITSASTKDINYAGVGVDLTTKDEYHDLSKMTDFSIKVKGSGTVRFFFKTKDFEGEDWGFYGFEVKLTSDWKTISTAVADILPEEGTTAGGTSFKAGYKDVSTLQIQTKDNKDAELYLDDMVFVGMTFADCGFTPVSVLTHQTVQNLRNKLVIENSHVTYSVAQPQNLSISLFNGMGSRIATLFSGRANLGVFTINVQNNMANGTYFIRMNNAQGTVSHKFTIVK